MHCSGVEWNGVDGMHCSGVEWNGVDGMQCSGVEWNICIFSILSILVIFGPFVVLYPCLFPVVVADVS